MIVDTALLSPDADDVQAYCGLDVCVTLEVMERLREMYGPRLAGTTYAFSRALQAPALDMSLRGIRLDATLRDDAVERLTGLQVHLEARLNELSRAICDRPLNPKSPKQIIELFTEDMRLPPVWKSDKGVRKLSADEDALEKYAQYLYARPIVAHITAIRSLAKQIERLTTGVSAATGRMHTSFGIGSTDTGRFSSSKFVDGSGGNLQNVSRDDLEDEHNISIRRIFIADKGQVLFSLDREQSESREIGYMIGLLFDDWGYLDAQEAGDTHTMVARLTWTDDLPWTGKDREDRALAEKPFHRKGSRRQLAKILAHGSNLYGKPFTLARETYTTEALVERFQSRYFGRFPGIPRFHRWVAQQLQQKRELTTIFGRRRGFFDRTDDDATLRKAIAYLPQSATADRTNLGLYRVWANMRNDIQLLLQVHDSIVFQAPLTSDLEAIVQKAIELTEVALTSPSGRRYVVPGEMKWGFNLGNASEENPRGLRKWKAGKSAGEARSLAASAK